MTGDPYCPIHGFLLCNCNYWQWQTFNFQPNQNAIIYSETPSMTFQQILRNKSKSVLEQKYIAKINTILNAQAELGKFQAEVLYKDIELFNDDLNKVISILQEQGFGVKKETNYLIISW